MATKHCQVADKITFQGSN